ncbi:hypothetical protein GTW43_10610, partial [Streptomyces sp. SID5785]|nr:hypothetical protein [Streptomyces sp. SID5785]
MRAAASVSARYAAAGSLVLAALAAAPAAPASALPPGPDDARARGTALAAE